MRQPTARTLRLAAALCLCSTAARFTHGLLVTIELADGRRFGPAAVLDVGGLSQPEIRPQGRPAGMPPVDDESRLELTLVPSNVVARQLAAARPDSRHVPPRFNLIISATGPDARQQFEFDGCRVVATETSAAPRGPTTRFSMLCTRMIRR